ncbi:MAG: zf-TFIIB domain-containing protein [Halioglobus sp.]|nr:zf-TFIIB domain-containing protein [Halioglobus sp.]
MEIDYCPKCRGRLDRGELDKIIDRTSAVAPRCAQFRWRPSFRPGFAGIWL